MESIGDVNLDKRLGSFLVGTWVNSTLWALEVIQVWRWHKYFPNDNRWLKAAVLCAFASDTIHTITNYCLVYFYTITHWGDQTILSAIHFGITSYFICTGITGFIVQAFLVYRASGLIQQALLRVAVAVTLGSIVLLSFGATLWEGHMTTKDLHTISKAEYMNPATIWLSTAAGADILISGTLLVQLAIVKKRHDTLTEGGKIGSSSWVLRKLIQVTLETGSVTAAMALVVLVSYLADSASNVCFGLGFTLGRFYTLSMLYSLLLRKDLSRRQEEGASSVCGNGSFMTHTSKRNASQRVAMNGIHVAHVKTVRVERNEDREAIELAHVRRPQTADSQIQHAVSFKEAKALDEGKY
ncbi:hypothetical protein T439DRAFT_318418 [Meredithblackwellia eburnea MCA 4105]